MSFWIWTLGPAFLLAVGNLLQKLGLGRALHSRVTDRLVRGVLTDSLWWSGIAVSAVATLGYYGALSRFNISLVQPIMALNPVLTALGGWWLLKERLDTRSIWAIGLIVIGIVSAGMSVGETAGRERVGLLIGLLLAVLFCIWWIWNQPWSLEVRQALNGGLCFGLSAIFFKSASSFGKSFSFLWDGIRSWEFLGRGAGFVSFYVAGFALTQWSLAYGRALTVVPLSAAVGMILPMLAGLIVFAEPVSLSKVIALSAAGAGLWLFVRFEK